MRILVWNVENFTRQPRPNARGIGDQRLAIVRATVRASHADLVVLLETGSDGQIVIDDLKANRCVTDGLVTNVTGKDDPTGQTGKAYGGETYTILWPSTAPANVAIVGEQGNYRGGCLITTPRFSVCVLHAPSPSHDIQQRLAAISRCLLSTPDILCGDLNIKADETGSLTSVMFRAGYTYQGPNKATSLRTLENSVLESPESQPYDQAWTKNGGSLTVTAKVMTPALNKFDQNALSVAIGLYERALTATPAAGPRRRSTRLPNADETGQVQSVAAVLLSSVGDLNRVPLDLLPDQDLVKRLKKMKVSAKQHAEDLQGLAFASQHDLEAQLQVSTHLARQLQLTVFAVQTHNRKPEQYAMLAAKVAVSDHLPLIIDVN